MKVVLVILLLLALTYGLYSWLFARGEYIYERLPQVKVGMPQAAVRTLLGKPDTTYAWSSGSNPQVMEYFMGFGAPDAVRIFLDHDTVTAVIYNQ
jgi:hypothetical protein